MALISGVARARPDSRDSGEPRGANAAVMARDSAPGIHQAAVTAVNESNRRRDRWRESQICELFAQPLHKIVGASPSFPWRCTMRRPDSEGI
jgi:hypothetical protein